MFTAVRRATVLFLLLVLFWGCTQSLKSLTRAGINITKDSTSIGCGNNEIKLHYTGCGGLYIQQDQTGIIIDPFFSNPRLLSVVAGMIRLKTIKSDTAMIGLGKRRLLDSMKISESILRTQTKAVFAAHSHYDHLMDIPYVEENWLGNQADVYINKSGLNACYNAVERSRFFDIEKCMSNQDSMANPVEIPGDNGVTIRVYPIRASHNPHIPPGIKLFRGSVEQPISSYDTSVAKTNAYAWREGQTVSFLIDFVKEGKIQYRMFVQSSSCDYPMGIPPLALLEKKTVDLAVLGVASYHFSKRTYPCQYLETLKPSHVMLIHWEDFFRRYNKPTKAVRATCVRRFFKQYEKCQLHIDHCDGNPNDYVLPVPGVTMNVRY